MLMKQASLLRSPSPFAINQDEHGFSKMTHRAAGSPVAFEQLCCRTLQTSKSNTATVKLQREMTDVEKIAHAAPATTSSTSEKSLSSLSTISDEEARSPSQQVKLLYMHPSVCSTTDNGFTALKRQKNKQVAGFSSCQLNDKRGER